MTRNDNLYLKYDILQVAQMAKAHKAIDSKVINGTVGVLYNDDNEIWAIPEVDNLIRNLSNDEIYNYSPLDGGDLFKSAVKNWVFSDIKATIEAKMAIDVMATPGGTGALSIGVCLNLHHGETLLLPDFYWSPYKGMANGHSCDIYEYEMFEDGHFNQSSFEQGCYELIKRQNKVVTILNDPCNNPTGYSLSNLEFEKYLNFLNSLNCEVTLIYDIAYLDYYIDGLNEVRNHLALLGNLKENVTIIIAHSCSKSFSAYGLRVGSAIVMNRNPQKVETFINKAKIYARTHWSSVSRPGINMLIHIEQNKELRNNIIKRLSSITDTVKKRAEIFTKEAKLCHLPIYKYGGGFFMTIMTNHSYEAFSLLIKEGIYLIPLAKGLRIAICGISTNELYGLAKRIKDILNTIEA